MISFDIIGEPQGKARPRVVRNNGTSRAYTPQKTKDYESLIRTAYLIASGEKTSKPVEIFVMAYMRIPKSVSKSRREEMLFDAILPTKKPDLDNIAKVVCDALNGVAYNDDKQVVSMHVHKRYAVEPHIHIEIKEADYG